MLLMVWTGFSLCVVQCSGRWLVSLKHSSLFANRKVRRCAPINQYFKKCSMRHL